MFAKRCQVIVRKRSETLAALLYLSKPINGEAVADVNEKAVEEINRHKLLERSLMNQKKEQMMKKRLLVTKVVMLLRDLPETMRAWYGKRLKKILMARQSSEPIEIGSDSDMELVQEEGEEEEDRGPPVLEAQQPISIMQQTPPFEELPVLEKQMSWLLKNRKYNWKCGKRRKAYV
nr:unnamed protein product [Callosobruchus analis]